MFSTPQRCLHTALTCTFVLVALATGSEAKEGRANQLLRGDKASVVPLRCRGDSGNAVDWFAAFKFPNGYQYAAYEPGKGLHMSQDTLNSSSKGAVSSTTAQFFGVDSNEVSYIAYNDQPGDSGSSIYGHTKGFMAFNSAGGFWMIHSVPNWPLSDEWNRYKGFPENEIIYGQSFLCINLEFEDFNNVGGILQYNRPNIYHSHLTSEAWNGLQKLKGAVSGDHISNAGFTMHEFSSGDTTFKIFGKNADWGKDLYDSLIAPTLQQSLYVESWIRGYEIGPACTPQYQYTVVDVEYLKILDQSYKETQDHSKWAVSLKSSYVCIGDINRMTSQYHRGGGSACFKSPELHQTILSAVTEHDSCSTQ
eukprot:gb/GECG01014514.1/.p1 GENE.gb/GECG01014514.1/~~gb/GECG01014514.1/.p1  ORF type:complete len:364 (+),score=25.63 gb/GECG01014514.1/:1-1092(+)